MISLKKAAKYRAQSLNPSLWIYYLIVIGVCMGYVIAIGTTYSDVREEVSILNGIEFGSAIFVFSYTVSEFKEFFDTMLQNNVSRKSQFKGIVLAGVCLACIMAFIDIVIATTLYFLTNGHYHSLYREIYGSMNVLKGLLWVVGLHLTVAMTGYLIATLYQLLKGWRRVVLAAGLPVSIFVIMPVLDENYLGGELFRKLAEIFGRTIASSNAVVGVGSFVILSAMLAFITGKIVTRLEMS